MYIRNNSGARTEPCGTPNGKRTIPQTLNHSTQCTEFDLAGTTAGFAVIREYNYSYNLNVHSSLASNYYATTCRTVYRRPFTTHRCHLLSSLTDSKFICLSNSRSVCVCDLEKRLQVYDLLTS